MGRYDESNWRREDVGPGARSYDRDERYGRPRMQWENDQDRAARSEPQPGGVWRDHGGDRHEGHRGHEGQQRAMVRPDERGWHDRAERSYAEDHRGGGDRGHQGPSGWERQPSPSRQWHGSEMARDEHDHYRGYARDEHRGDGYGRAEHRSEARSPSFDRWQGGDRSERHVSGRYDGDRSHGQPLPREHRPEDDFGKVTARFDDERYSGSAGGRSASRPSPRTSPDGYGMRMVRPGDRPSHDPSNDDERYGYGRSERGRFDQPEDDRYGRSGRTPYENNWR